MYKVDFRTVEFPSSFLNRIVKFDIYTSGIGSDSTNADLVLINDGQDLLKMRFIDILNDLQPQTPLLVIGLHAGEQRKQEYGVAGFPDYMGRGAKASLYSKFIIEELLSNVDAFLPGLKIQSKALAGFSLGGLMAFDLLMDYPKIFTLVGVFSGSFWWRSKSLEDGYDEEQHRIMHAKIRTKKKEPGLKFFIQTGQLDETADRNNNGIIDSIDDALGIISELSALGYTLSESITYLELKEGRHDVQTWGSVMPDFLKWLITNRN
jgi:enterochelin esterase-like enzyme